MEVHQHTHTARKKWFHYFWEFFMLFLAVTLGFFVENIREHSIEHKRAGEYAKMLRMDLMNDTFQLHFFIQKKDSFQILFSKIQRVFEKKHDSVTFGDFYFLKTNGIDLSVFVANDATYSQMKSSGSLRYFTSTELSAKLGFYDSQVKRFEDNWSAIKTIYGGFGSNYFLRFAVISDNFLKENPDKIHSGTLRSAGYNFEAWDEAGKIIQTTMEGLEMLFEDTYPSMREKASELISILSKEYHLK